jgi:hypothetical protein
LRHGFSEELSEAVGVEHPPGNVLVAMDRFGRFKLGSNDVRVVARLTQVERSALVIRDVT